MTHQQELLDYLTSQGASEAKAIAWLNTHCPHWQTPLPVAKQEEVVHA